jgi:hypothetical protein
LYAVLLLIIGSSAVVKQASKRGAPRGSWLEQMLARKPRMLVTVALANKMARIVVLIDGRASSATCDLVQRTVQIVEDVIDIFETDRHADQPV